MKRNKNEIKAEAVAFYGKLRTLGVSHSLTLAAVIELTLKLAALPKDGPSDGQEDLDAMRDVITDIIKGGG